MPDSRQHRGRHPEDAELFAPANWPRLQSAVEDYSWLLGRGYAEPSAIKIVGDRYELNLRQRMAVVRSACTDAARDQRLTKMIAPSAVAGQPLWIDGFNVLTTTEVALGGGIILAARDGCFRDIASVHGTYRNVHETRPAIEVVGETIDALTPHECRWYFDSPVGNSGRLKHLLLELASSRGWKWSVELVPNPDPILTASDAIVATADSVILEGCRRWLNLARLVIVQQHLNANMVPMIRS